MRRPSVTLTPVHSAHEARKMGLPEFARSFDHEFKPIFPSLVGWIDREMRAYAQIDTRTLVTCGIHPRLNAPIDTLALAKATISLLSQYYPGFLMNAPGQKDTVFTDHAMRTFGLSPWPNRIFHAGLEE